MDNVASWYSAAVSGFDRAILQRHRDVERSIVKTTPNVGRRANARHSGINARQQPTLAPRVYSAFRGILLRSSETALAQRRLREDYRLIDGNLFGCCGHATSTSTTSRPRWICKTSIMLARTAEHGLFAITVTADWPFCTSRRFGGGVKRHPVICIPEQPTANPKHS